MSWRDRGVGLAVLVGCGLLAGGGTAVADVAAGGESAASVPSLILGAVRLNERCLGSGPNAAADLRVSYALNTPARVTFTVQRRTARGLATPRHCPRMLQPTNTSAAYASVGATDVDATAGPGYVTVQQPGVVTPGLLRGVGRLGRIASPRPQPRPLTATVPASGGTHRIALLHTLLATRGLAPGRYRIVIQATRDDAEGSRLATVWFWVLRAG